MNLTHKEYAALGRTLADSAGTILYNIEYKEKTVALTKVQAAIQTLQRAEEALLNSMSEKKDEITANVLLAIEVLQEAGLDTSSVTVSLTQSLPKDEDDASKNS